MISAPADLVFTHLLNFKAWPEWSKSVADINVTLRATPLVNLYHHNVEGRREESEQWLARAPRVWDSEESLTDTSITLWTVEDPRRPQILTCSSIVIDSVTQPQEEGAEVEISKHIENCGPSFSHDAGHNDDNFRAERSPFLGKGNGLSMTATKTGQCSLPIDITKSFVFSYSVHATSLNPEANSRGDRYPLPAFLKRKKHARQPYTCTHFVTPEGTASCVLTTTMHPGFQELHNHLSTGRFGQSLTKSGRLSSRFTPLACMDNIARDLGGHCVRLILEQRMLDTIVPEQRIRQRQRRGHVSTESGAGMEKNKTQDPPHVNATEIDSQRTGEQSGKGGTSLFGLHFQNAINLSIEAQLEGMEGSA
ncbi:hypothetical protein UCRPC4_g03527 [Phaeomoniella chlamydospora]|uniref:Uncharacterized protein n=1 Tax=Phaeomoniella chlamydospora TaxID=158046 RepID=A0A0G2EH79_PHACM|nr:hypothetical protein UCRPC4_g03527 [Phaeomoniella chlamydospora]